MILRKILLAEDDEDDQMLFHDFLKHRVDLHLMPVAENGLKLVEILEQIGDQKGLPDLIILDQNMPRQNGLQTLRLLKSNQRYSRIPVMMYTTYADQQLIEVCTRNGACAVMLKPVTKDEYNQMVDTFIRLSDTLQ